MSILETREQKYQELRDVEREVERLCKILTKIDLPLEAEYLEDLEDSLSNYDYVQFLVRHGILVTKDTLNIGDIYSAMCDMGMIPTKENIRILTQVTEKIKLEDTKWRSLDTVKRFPLYWKDYEDGKKHSRNPLWNFVPGHYEHPMNEHWVPYPAS